MSSIISHAQADTTDNIKGHIPEAPHSGNISNPSENVGNLRFVVFPSIHAQKLSVRVLRATVFRRLEPITNLRSGEEFMKVWLQCVQCHYALWERGVEHTDPSVVNLMTNSFDESKGVLNDWDLAIIRIPDKENLPHSKRTEILPFMALDLLSREYHDGKMPRLYRHDLEAFIWILAWVFLQYQGGTRINRDLQSWEGADYNTIRRAKSDFLQNLLKKVRPTSQFRNEWPIAQMLLYWVLKEQTRRGKPEDLPPKKRIGAKTRKVPAFVDRSALQAAPVEKTPEQVYKEFLSVIYIMMKDIDNPALDYIDHYLPGSV